MQMKTLVLMATFFLGCDGKSLSTDGGAGATGRAGTTGNAGATGSAGATGNAGATGTAGASGTGGLAGGAGAGGTAGNPPHRPAAITCAPSITFPGSQDAGVTSCVTDGDCRPEGGFAFAAYCHNHVCTSDQCFADSDCLTGQLCECSFSFGHGLHGNFCVSTGCHVDADCPSGLCSPTGDGGVCGSFLGYRCRSASDTCRTDSDCPNKPDGGVSLPNKCIYAPEVGHWQCTPGPFCVG
jgi:hypothetical protein